MSSNCMELDCKELNNIIDNIDDDNERIKELPDNSYECSMCGTIVQVDPFLIHNNDANYDSITLHKLKYWHSKYAYSIEYEPDKWLTFCRRVCQIKYERQYESGWEFSQHKRLLLS